MDDESFLLIPFHYDVKDIPKFLPLDFHVLQMVKEDGFEEMIHS